MFESVFLNKYYFIQLAKDQSVPEKHFLVFPNSSQALALHSKLENFEELQLPYSSRFFVETLGVWVRFFYFV